MAATPSLNSADLAHIDAACAATDQLLDRNYPGDDGSRQPVHTVYVPADRFTPTFAADWGAQGQEAINNYGGLEKLGALLGQDAELAAEVAPRVAAKLANEAIEDLRMRQQSQLARLWPPPSTPEQHRRSLASVSSALNWRPAPEVFAPWTCSSLHWPSPVSSPTASF